MTFAAKPSPVRTKSYAFALQVVRLARKLQVEDHEYVLSKQVLRSGTSIGANVEEANAGQSKKDFAAKMAIASKEARETSYWIRILIDSGLASGPEPKALLSSCEELIRLLTAIVKTTQNDNQ